MVRGWVLPVRGLVDPIARGCRVRSLLRAGAPSERDGNGSL